MPEKEGFYFPHESNFKDRPDSIAMLEELGAAGYGTVWILMEVLRDMPGYTASTKILPGIARRFNLDPDTVNRVIADYHIFEVSEDGQLSSPYLNGKMQAIDAKRSKLKEAAKRGNEIRWGSPPESHGDRHPNPVGLRSESQGKERKEKGNTEMEHNLSQNNSVSGPPAGRRRFVEGDVAMTRARYFHSLLSKTHGPGAIKEPNWQKWADTMDKLTRIDRRDPDRIKALIIAIFKDPFWSKNVLSPDKLREKFDELSIKLLTDNPKGSETTPAPSYAKKVNPDEL